MTPCALVLGAAAEGRRTASPHAGDWRDPTQDPTDTHADLFGCGPAEEKHDVIRPKGPRPAAEPPPGKALVYIVRRKGARFRNFPQNKLAANGRWVAVLKRGDYSFFFADPGPIRLCYTGDRGLKEGSGFVYLTAEAGRTYYLRGDTGAMGQTTKLSLVGEEEGKALVSESKYATFRVKK
jgi:hypothetical protein